MKSNKSKGSETQFIYDSNFGSRSNLTNKCILLGFICHQFLWERAYSPALAKREAMKTMKAMKGVKAMKAVTKQNQKQTAGKAAKSKAAPKTSLRNGNLDKLGQMSLKDKVKKISEGHDDEIEAAMVLKDHMSPEEKVRSWNRYNKHLSKVGNEEEKEEFNNSSKKDKGTLTAIWLLRTEAPKFCTVARKVSLEKVLRKEKNGSVRKKPLKNGERLTWTSMWSQAGSPIEKQQPGMSMNIVTPRIGKRLLQQSMPTNGWKPRSTSKMKMKKKSGKHKWTKTWCHC